MRFRSLAIAACAATALVVAPAASADPAPVTGVELNQPADQVVTFEAKFDLTRDNEIALQKVRELRADMWDRNVPFNGETLQYAAKVNGLKTKEAYVNDVRIDHGYALIALQRALEEAGGIDHDRPYNETCSNECGSLWTATIQGEQPFGENLSGEEDMAKAMHGWGYDELDALYDSNGQFNNANGHLYNLINPDRTWFGVASVRTAEGTASAWEAAGKASGVTAFPEGARTEALARPANNGETPSTKAVPLPKKSTPSRGQGTQGTVSLGGGSETEKIIGIIFAIIGVLAGIYSFVKQYLPDALPK